MILRVTRTTHLLGHFYRVQLIGHGISGEFRFHRVMDILTVASGLNILVIEWNI